MSKVLIAGCGNFGSWWAVGLLKDKSIDLVTIYDPAVNSQSLIESRLPNYILSDNKFKKRLNYVSDIRFLESSYDLAVLACNSHERLRLFSTLLSSIKCTHWVLEKVLTSSLTELCGFNQFALDHNVYVSHSRRCQPIWLKMSNSVSQNSTINSIDQTLGPWDLASNSFHFVDIICWLFNTNLLSAEIIEGEWGRSEKRKGRYFDLTGALMLSYENNITHTIVRKKTSTSNIFVFSQDNHSGTTVPCFRLDELYGITDLVNDTNSVISLYNWSELVPSYTQQLFQNNDSFLPPLSSVFNNTYILLDAFRSHWSSQYGNDHGFALG